MSSLAHELPGGTQAQCRCRLVSLAQGVGQLLVIHTFWVAISVASSVDPTLSTAQQTRWRSAREIDLHSKRIDTELRGTVKE